jgi:hypothetical protein
MKSLAAKATAVVLAAAALSAVGVGAASAATPDMMSPVSAQMQIAQASRSFHVYNQTNNGDQLQIVGASGPDWAGHPPIGANLANGQSWDFAVNYDAATTVPTTLELAVVNAHGRPIPGNPGATFTLHVDQWGNPSVTVTDARVGVIPTVHGMNIYMGQSGGA